MNIGYRIAIVCLLLLSGWQTYLIDQANSEIDRINDKLEYQRRLDGERDFIDALYWHPKISGTLDEDRHTYGEVLDRATEEWFPEGWSDQ